MGSRPATFSGPALYLISTQALSFLKAKLRYSFNKKRSKNNLIDNYFRRVFDHQNLRESKTKGTFLCYTKKKKLNLVPRQMHT